MALIDQIKKYYTLNESTGCWDWHGYTNTQGYARVFTAGKLKRVHRMIYELFVGEIPEGLFVCHHCDNPRCINPEHLFIGTHQDNMNDMRRKGRLVASFGFAGRTHTNETKRKIGESNQKLQKGKGNSQYGTCWIYNSELRENKKIPRFELNERVKQGWIRGRKMRFQ